MTKLALRHCTPVKKGSKPISPGIARSLLNQINNKWRLDAHAKFVERDFEFEDFRHAMEFANVIAWVANGQDHHPDLEIASNRCKVRFSTHTAGGLTVNDFICAAKIDALFSEEMLKSASPAPAKRPHPAAPTIQDNDAPAGLAATVARDSGQLSGLSLDSDEVEELLNKKLPDEEEEPTAQDPADEFELLDPEAISPPPDPAQTAPRQTTPVAAPEKPAIAEEPSMGPGLTSTVILPPGMQAVGENPPDEDEDATVILPETTDIDPEETLVGAGNPVPSLPPISPRNIEDDDEVKTVILNPTLASKPEDETVIKPPASPAPRKPDSSNPSPSSASVSLPPLRPKTDNDEVGTLILSSNPFNHPSFNRPAAAGTNKPQEAAKQHTAAPKQVQAAATSKPPAEEPDHMGTMILSPAEIEALNRKQAERKPASPQKADDDDTLVMHVNDFKKLKKDQ